MLCRPVVASKIVIYGGVVQQWFRLRLGRCLSSAAFRNDWPLMKHGWLLGTDSRLRTPNQIVNCSCFFDNLSGRAARNSGKLSFHSSSRLCADVIQVEGPAFAESITEGDIRWLKQVGDFVQEDELVAEIETDKTSVEVPAPHSGVIESLLVADGEKVVAKQPLYTLRLSAEAPAGAPSPAAPAPEAPAPPEEEPPAKVAEPPPEQPPVSTVGPIPETMPPVPPVPKEPIFESRPVSEIEVTPLVQKPAPPPSSTPPPAPTAAPSQPPPVTRLAPGGEAITGSRTETRVKMNRMRQRIAQRLKDAQNTYAMLTTFNEIDMSNVVELRSKYKDIFLKKHGVKLSFMSPFVKAAAYALQHQPVVNAVIDEQEIIYRHYIDISIAVATPRGLVVPVLRNVESLNYAQIEAQINELGAQARDNKLAIEDMEGGTFTISNGGVFGSLYGTPIINPPQSAILGMHAIVDRPMAVSGKVEIRPMMIVALTYDHRLVDGREAVTFLRKIKLAVEDPRTILLDL